MKTRRHRSPERGVVLIATAVLLVILTVIALAGVSMISTQTRVATNSADVQVAYQTAEAALSDAQNQLIAGSFVPSAFAQNNGGLYVFDPSAPPVWSDAHLWLPANASKVLTSNFQGGSSSAPAYVIEQMPSVIKPGQDMKRPTQVYRITARATGRSGNAPVVLQSTVQIQ